MFDLKKKSLYETVKASAQPDTLSKSANVFEKEMYEQRHSTVSGNGAHKLDTTGHPILDDFASLAKYKAPREVKDIMDTMETLYNYNPLLAIKEMVYLRLITRDTRYMKDVFKAQRGQGLRHEFLGRMMWLATHHRSTFEKNLMLFVSAGSWQDVFDLLEMDLSYIHNGRNRVLDWKWLTAFICNYLQDEDQCNLIKKYLPQVKNSKRCTTLHSQCTNYIGKYLAGYLFPDKEKATAYAQYRKLKASGTAHQWQQIISRGDFGNINFNAIAGRALDKLVNKSKFLENHNLEHKYEEWIMSQPVAKFTGYPYELFNGVTSNMKAYKKMTINKQFEGLVETARQNMNTDSKFIVCIDSSGSMTSNALGTNVSAFTVAKSMGLYFSYLLDGPFKDTFMEFESQVHLHSWSHYKTNDGWRNIVYTADNPVDKFMNRMSDWCGSTNFIGVADEFVRLLSKCHDESQFPTGVICISDGNFNNCGTESNFVTFKKVLLDGGFSREFVNNFKLVLWDIPNNYYGDKHPARFEALGDSENFFYISGFDGSALAFLTGVEQPDKPTVVPKTAEELFMAAMDQDLLNEIQL